MTDHAHEEGTKHHQMRIHIDRMPYHSPNPTTGSALYALGQVALENALFREVEGDHEDKLIPNGGETVHLREDEHFYSAPLEYKIIVNSRQNVVTSQTLSFSQIVALAFNPVPTGPNTIFTILYEHGPHTNPEGTLPEGGTVQVRNRMVFYVTQTNKS